MRHRLLSSALVPSLLALSLLVPALPAVAQETDQAKFVRLTRQLEDLATAARAATRGEPLVRLKMPQLREFASLHQAVFELSNMQLLLHEANHRIKNSLQIVAGSLGMQSRDAADPDGARPLRGSASPYPGHRPPA